MYPKIGSILKQRNATGSIVTVYKQDTLESFMKIYNDV